LLQIGEDVANANQPGHFFARRSRRRPLDRCLSFHVSTVNCSSANAARRLLNSLPVGQSLWSSPDFSCGGRITPVGLQAFYIYVSIREGEVNPTQHMTIPSSFAIARRRSLPMRRRTQPWRIFWNVITRIARTTKQNNRTRSFQLQGWILRVLLPNASVVAFSGRVRILALPRWL
jgi:hypothetical protein